MAQLSRGILGAVAIATGVTLTFGAAQFASGRDLSGISQNLLSQSAQAQEAWAQEAWAQKARVQEAQIQQAQIQQADVSTASSINRAGKSDRVANAAKANEPSQTFSLRLSGHPDTSVIVRIPMVREARSSTLNSNPLSMQTQDRKVACEPMVSVLTEVSKRLQPGRCVT